MVCIVSKPFNKYCKPAPAANRLTSASNISGEDEDPENHYEALCTPSLS